MIRFLVSTVINALGLWAVTTIVPGIALHPYGGNDVWPTIGSYLLVGAIFGIVTAIIAPVIKVLAIPLYILTFGLISLVINGALLLLVAWLSNLIHDGNGVTISGFTDQGLTIESMGLAILGALVMSVSTFVARWFMRITGLLN
jgi:putative membrane protein